MSEASALAALARFKKNLSEYVAWCDDTTTKKALLCIIIDAIDLPPTHEAPNHRVRSKAIYWTAGLSGSATRRFVVGNSYSEMLTLDALGDQCWQPISCTSREIISYLERALTVGLVSADGVINIGNLTNATWTDPT